MTIDSIYFPQYNEIDDNDIVYGFTLESLGGVAMEAWYSLPNDQWQEAIVDVDFMWSFGGRAPIYPDGKATWTHDLTSTSAERLLFARDTPITNENVFVEGESFDGNLFENSVDKLTMICQELEGHYVDCSETQVPGPGPGEECLEWGNNLPPDDTTQFTEIWSGGTLSQQGFTAFKNTIQRQGLMAVKGNKIYQAILKEHTSDYTSLEASGDGGQTWLPCLAPYDSEWEARRGSPIPQYPGTMGYRTLRFIGDKLYTLYSYLTEGSVFYTNTTNVDGQEDWTREHTMWDNVSYAPNRNNYWFGVHQYAYYLGSTGITWTIGGRVGPGPETAIQVGPTPDPASTNGPAPALEILYLDNVPGSPSWGASSSQHIVKDGWYISQSSGESAIFAYNPSDPAQGDRGYDGVFWNTTHWANFGYHGAFSFADAKGAYNGLLLENPIGQPWVDWKNVIYIPLPGRETWGDPSFAQYYEMRTADPSVPALDTIQDFSAFVVPIHVDDSPTDVRIFSLNEMEGNLYMVYAFGETVSGLCTRLYMRRGIYTGTDSAPTWSDPVIIEFPVGHHFNYPDGSGGGAWGYSNTQNKYYFSTSANNSVQTRQRIYSVDDPWVCLLFGELP